MQNIVDPKYISFKTAPGIIIWQKPWLDTSLERHLRDSHLRDISINFLCDLYGKKLFPIISAPDIFTRSRDVKQWNKTFKGVLHPWALFFKTLCIFSKNKATLDKVSYGSGQKYSKELKNHSL